VKHAHPYYSISEQELRGDFPISLFNRASTILDSLDKSRKIVLSPSLFVNNMRIFYGYKELYANMVIEVNNNLHKSGYF